MKKIRQNNQCPTQEVFTKCVRSWLESPETIIPDVSSVHNSQRLLLTKNKLDGIWQCEVISASTGDYQFLRIDILRRKMTKEKFG
jgi:hypothetical protein